MNHKKTLENIVDHIINFKTEFEKADPKKLTDYEIEKALCMNLAFNEVSDIIEKDLLK